MAEYIDLTKPEPERPENWIFCEKPQFDNKRIFVGVCEGCPRQGKCNALREWGMSNPTLLAQNQSGVN